jgi:C-terminal processing protease CtpA/Prc
LALCATAIAVAPGSADTREKREVRLAHRGGGGGYLGVQLEDLDKDDVSRLKLDGERGALLSEVVEGGPAAQAGLREGDVVVRFQGESIHSAAQLARLVSETPAGRAVTVEVSRDGAIQKSSVSLGERKRRAWSLPDFDFDIEVPKPPDAPVPPEAPQTPELPMAHFKDLLGEGFDFGDWGRAPHRLGIGYQEISDQLARYFKLPGDGGVLVSHVEQDGPAAKAGLMAGDVILEFAGNAIQNGRDLRSAVRDAEPGQDVTVKVQRDGKPIELKVTLAAQDRDERRHRRGVAL